MSTPFLVIAIALVGGIAVSLQGQFMGLMDRQIGTLESVFLTYGIGGVLVTLLLLFYRGGNIGQWQQLPWWTLSSGLLGLVIVASIGISVSRIGALAGFTLIVAAQFISAALIDHFGLFGAEIRTMDLSKLAGVSVIIAGVWLTIR
ncbi:MAG: DMT family transporter [Motiliproteus sp.]|nr:DMT family transporter [Motiliproteus sp.]MCW9053364.1 DMT family transporter [Motiliproteus sp.]